MHIWNVRRLWTIEDNRIGVHRRLALCMMQHGRSTLGCSYLYCKRNLQKTCRACFCLVRLHFWNPKCTLGFILGPFQHSSGNIYRTTKYMCLLHALSLCLWCYSEVGYRSPPPPVPKQGQMAHQNGPPKWPKTALESLGPCLTAGFVTLCGQLDVHGADGF